MLRCLLEDVPVHNTVTNWICMCDASVGISKESNGNCSEITKKISRIGTSGKFPGNCERDLMSALELPIATGLQY